MAKDAIKNPYEGGDDGQEILLSRRFALGFSILFLIMIVLAPVARHLWQLAVEEDEQWIP